MKYSLLDAINIFLFIVLIILIINKINKIEKFDTLCRGKCDGNHECSSTFFCDDLKKSCCKRVNNG